MAVFRKNIKGQKGKISLIILGIFLLAVLAGLLDYPVVWNKGADFLNQKTGLGAPHFFNLPFRLGLDLLGGAHLVYEADLSQIEPGNYDDSMAGVRDVIERRVNLFGVTEPIVQINKTGEHYRLIIELAGVKDIGQAIKMIGETPFLDFREERGKTETENILADQKELLKKMEEGLSLTPEEEQILVQDPYFKPTALTGRYLKSAQMDFNQQTFQSQVSLQFNDEGSKIFEELTQKNVGKPLAIYLDGAPISAPVVQEVISGGQAQITGQFSVDEAKQLVQRLNAGALPVPIKLISQESVGASLGKISLEQSLKAGLIGILAVVLFMFLYYRLSGFLAIVALLIYAAIVLAIFKLIPVTLTLAGITGFILSIGMAVDANILIFERMKEELKQGKSFGSAVDDGFSRAWSSIRDSNASSLITCAILYWLGTSIIKGFALTLAIGILVSMLSAIFITRQFLKLFKGTKLENYERLWR
ncbi:MAG: protein-export membrane protein SecD [Candidatus Portnoybacteria bacterium RIFCSPLOWO2_01_FULL_43_11]|uniref:Protein translocase subunit SecD n=3 Tax=Candidatus Portnoyibacteriota TaxID=1817913 RepID=A0A1G2FBC0_9BACT|nr:MAG: protein-export membrane protein SecD [Candidatus Portnoybacteria bacterium RIFCSPHIGHO2_01_FULL_40_12b]OGZ36667.1 MAG: protein-export membrane protein SecD [Candidatus Portnoybacteria bacterium RIFCSPHIGHO2_02_FULL_40_23]OGZ38550.1 MAG: protein-export membrane protein SecD [Candidatus Portnoybacteria bacterium RIFCSPLOWO2_01_FULL_43_11]OGZ40945.1 MAG: protein-export membrane protein SecD [Candidatus Portnoybacteria bacterium RIFCSPLOWO2_02_FULL_40_15]